MAWELCSGAGADEEWVQPLDAEDEEKCLHWVVPGDVEGLDCDPQDKVTSHAACWAAPRVAGTNKSTWWKTGSDNRLRFWAVGTGGTMRQRKNVLFMSPQRPQLQGNLAWVARNYEESCHRPQLELVGLQGTLQGLLQHRSMSHWHRDRCGIRRYGAQ